MDIHETDEKMLLQSKLLHQTESQEREDTKNTHARLPHSQPMRPHQYITTSTSHPRSISPFNQKRAAIVGNLEQGNKL